MSVSAFHKANFIAAISLFIFICGIWAIAPIWVNPCVPTHLSKEEVEQMRALPNYKYLTLEEQAESDQLHRKAEIPCGAQDLPTFEKLGASKFQGLILDELGFISKSLILRFEMVDTDENGGTYYFKGYTFFYIPLYRVFAGGSGYMEIDMLPFENDGLYVGEWK